MYTLMSEDPSGYVLYVCMYVCMYVYMYVCIVYVELWKGSRLVKHANTYVPARLALRERSLLG